MESYQQAIRQLSESLSGVQERNDTLANLWTMLILSIFELISDPTGEAFLQHIGVGVAEVVESLGPGFFREGRARRFFIEWRSFELSRCVLLTRPSVLGQERWLEHSRWARGEESEMHAEHFDGLMDIVFRCVDFVRRWVLGRGMLHLEGLKLMSCMCSAAKAPESSSIETTLSVWELVASSVEGHHLRNELQTWGKEAYARRAAQLVSNDSDLLGLIYYSAISIYVSGPFDYSSIWRDNGIATPALRQEDVDFHVGSILKLSEQVLQERSVAGAALFFPLRIAGARVKAGGHRNRKLKVDDLLERIKVVYAASEAIAQDLG